MCSPTSCPLRPRTRCRQPSPLPRHLLPTPELSWLLQSTRDEVEDAAAARSLSAETAAVNEEELKFSLAGPGQRVAAAALGVVGPAGALVLGWALADPKLSGAKLVGSLGFIQRSPPSALVWRPDNAILLVRCVKMKRGNNINGAGTPTRRGGQHGSGRCSK